MIVFARIPVGLAALVLLVTGCSKGPPTASQVPAAKSSDDSAQSPPNTAAPPAKQAPPVYRVKLETTKGDILIEVYRKWSPMAADHFYELVEAGFYDNCKFFRAITNPPVIVQTGINGDPQVHAKWRVKAIPDEHYQCFQHPRNNKRGTVAFAKSSVPNSRSTQFFINLVENDHLDNKGFTPFGKVLEGMAIADSLYGGYGEEPQNSAWRIIEGGNEYLKAAFPKLDSIKKATILSALPEALKEDGQPKQELSKPAAPEKPAIPGNSAASGKAAEKPKTPSPSHPPDPPPAR